jgi:hypothetical protein
MKASDLPALPPARVHEPIAQSEIDRINDLYASMRRQAKQLLKDAMEIGEWFRKIRKDLPREKGWYEWVRENFPKMSVNTVWGFQKLAANREFIISMTRNDNLCSVREALQLISQRNKMNKPRVRAVVVREDADPLVLLEAKLKNYVINLWMLRYLQTEIEGMLGSMELTPDQVLRVLHYVCKEHHEVEDEVLRTFKPGLKIVSKGA